MFRLLWMASVHTRWFLWRYMPSNRLLDATRTRRGLIWALPAMLLALPYLVAANACTAWLANNGPGWLNLFVILFTWNAMKFLINGPIALLLLARVRLDAMRERRASHPSL